MQQDYISILWQRYLTACEEGVEPYFDADEIDALLESFEEKDDYTHYELILELGLRLHPYDYELKIWSCRLHLRNEEYEEALALLEGVVDLDDFDANMMRMECYCAVNRYPDIVEYVERLVQSGHPQTENVFEFLTPIMSDMNMISEAKKFIHWGLQIFPDSIPLKDELCYVCELDGNFEEAINICNGLIDKEPYSYDYWFTLGRLYSLTNDFNNAIDALDFALTCDDSNDDLKVLKAYCLFMNESYEKALEVYSELTDDDDDDDSIIHVNSMMAECYIRLDDFDRAYNRLRELIDMRTGEALDTSVYISFIHTCIKTNRRGEAIRILSESADIFPRNVRGLSMLALSCLESEKDGLTIQIINKIFDKLNIMNDNEDDKNDKGKKEIKVDFQNILEEKKTPTISEVREKAARKHKKTPQANPDTSSPKSKYISPEDICRDYINNKYNKN
ncbi:MAG: tetratricopeptide repeat protein [Tannerellaceae bacterium]|jgi:tetratricopeptide (TPR) repeat protein|nr:tetratricopeptide repeat protein [Tannerellaceae bacterium]